LPGVHPAAYEVCPEMRSETAPARSLELKFRLDEVPPEGRRFAGVLTEASLGADLPGMVGELGYRPTGAARIEGNVYRSSKSELVVDGRVTAEVGFDCVRCLTDRVLTVNVRDDHVLVRRKPRPVDDGDDDGQTVEEKDLEEPDVESFTGEEIDLTEVFRQDLLLALPMNPSCADLGAEDCRDLVAEEVTDEPQIDPRWAPLLEMKKKMT